MALVTFNSAAHNKPSLIRDLLDQILPQLYNETKVRVRSVIINACVDNSDCIKSLHHFEFYFISFSLHFVVLFFYFYCFRQSPQASLVLFLGIVERKKRANSRENCLPRGHAIFVRVSLVLLSFSKFTERRRQQRVTDESRRDLLFTLKVLKRRRLKPFCREVVIILLLSINILP